MRAKVVDPEDTTNNQTGQNSGRVGGMVWNVEIQIQLFLKESSLDAAIGIDTDSKIHVVDACG